MITFLHCYLPTLPYHTIPYHTIPYHTMPQHFLTFHYLTLHYVTLHYVTLYYVIYQCTYVHTYTYLYIYIYIWRFPKTGVPQNGCFIVEKSGGTPVSGNLHTYIYIYMYIYIYTHIRGYGGPISQFFVTKNTYSHGAIHSRLMIYNKCSTRRSERWMALPRKPSLDDLGLPTF